MSVYSFVDTQATLVGPGGSISLGAGAGNAQEGISFEFLDDKDGMLVGADGTVVHSLRASKAARVTVRLLKTSPVNAMLSQMYNTQIQSSALWARNILTISNPVVGDDIPCSNVAFQKHPAITWAQDANFNEWMFNAGQADPILGAGI
jgi:hypothetical protein